MSVAFIAQAVDHQQLEWIDTAPMAVLLDGAATNGQLTMLRTALPAGAASPVHTHRDEDEMFLVVTGAGSFWCGDDRYEVGEGGVVFLPRAVPHAYRMSQDTDLLTICTPSGAEGFFRAVGHDLSRPRPDGWAITPRSLALAAGDFGLEILGPPPS